MTTRNFSLLKVTEYVAGFLFTLDLKHVVLIRKTHPTWQAGKLNGVGGHIENGESSLDAMRREFAEETGIVVRDWNYFCLLQDQEPFNWAVHWYWAFVDEKCTVQSSSDEVVDWFSVKDIIEKPNQLKPIPNIRWLLMIAKDCMRQFVPENAFYVITESSIP
jgi:8-oxo-dGTP diphosphatase